MHSLLEAKKSKNVYVREKGYICVLEKHRKGKSASARVPNKVNMANIQCTTRFAPLGDNITQSFGNKRILMQDKYTDVSFVFFGQKRQG